MTRTLIKGFPGQPSEHFEVEVTSKRFPSNNSTLVFETEDAALKFAEAVSNWIGCAYVYRVGD